jgi:glycerol kinase
MTAYAADGVRWERLKIDGGMVCNDWLAQDMADMLDLTVERPAFIETTALGAAMLAAVGSGIYPDLAAAAAAMRGAVTHFEPAMDDAERDRRLAGWKEALGKI